MQVESAAEMLLVRVVHLVDLKGPYVVIVDCDIQPQQFFVVAFGHLAGG